jgi:hypothetical protein
MVNEGWIWRGQIITRAFAMRHAGFLTDLDILTPDELDLEPVYRDFWRPQGLGWAVGTVIPIPTGENVLFVMTRRTERGPVEHAIVQKLDELRPHLARSALVSARLQLERARAASETLALIGLPALVLDERGRVRAANRLIESLTGYIHWRAQDRVALKEGGANKLLREAIATICLCALPIVARRGRRDRLTHGFSQPPSRRAATRRQGGRKARSAPQRAIPGNARRLLALALAALNPCETPPGARDR